MPQATAEKVGESSFREDTIELGQARDFITGAQKQLNQIIRA
ncbi:hypothetical protein [Nostoc sp. FACHB-888]|nr:hypothetical protein [Nostoc sp. FACHB-888]